MGSLPGADPVRVLIVGGCYAGISTAVNLLDLGDGLQPRMARPEDPYRHHEALPRVRFEITIVDERDGYYHIIGSPLALADETYAHKAWVKFTDIPALHGSPSSTVRTIQGSVTGIEPTSRTALVRDIITGETTPREYDFLVVASGLRRSWPVVPQSLTRKAYLLEVEAHIHAVAAHGSPDPVVVVGGGAVGIEMAAELKMVSPGADVVLVHSRGELLSSEGLADECKDKALELLGEAGVRVLLNHRVKSKEKSGGGYDVQFTNGSRMRASQVVMAMSNSSPSTTFLPACALDSDGYVKIQANLGFVPGTPNASHHFCGGDAARWTGIKRCGGAMHGGHLIARNIHQTLLAEKTGIAPSWCRLQEVVPPMIGLAVGKKAVASGPEGTVSGEDVMWAYFRDDLGFDICWEYMQLGGRKVAA